jgi:peptide chain release factor 3
VELLLDGLLEHGSPPAPRTARNGGAVFPDNQQFSGFVFKIQANMDPRHRDRVAFVRIVSGKFSRDMAVHHAQTGKKVRLSNVSKVFGSERETVDDAYPGDVVGIVSNGRFAIGDTLTEDAAIEYAEIPAFAPEAFAFIQNIDTAQAKRFRSGLDQLLQEGVAQAFTLPDEASGLNRLIGAGGPLQFDVMQYRLESEYGAGARWKLAPWTEARWLHPDTPANAFPVPRGSAMAIDNHGERVLLFRDMWALQYFEKHHADVRLSRYPFAFLEAASRKPAPVEACPSAEDKV